MLFRSMFGFAIYNTKDNSLFIARDFFGIKPMHYTQIGNDFVYASEIKSILEYPKFEKKFNRKALDSYLSFQYAVPPETFFEGVYCLMPGHYLWYKDGEVETTRYFEARFNPNEEMTEEEAQFNKDTLEALYASTQLISNRYRNFVILQWLYDELSTSEITYERAVDLYNEESLKNTVINASGRVTGAINSMHSSMISGFDALYDAVDEGNEVLAKTRRDQNLANTAGIIQRHNLNKMMKSQNAKLDEHFNK